jgi:hypothetical protein
MRKGGTAMAPRTSQQAKAPWFTRWVQLRRSEIIAGAITFLLLGLIPLVISLL